MHLHEEYAQWKQNSLINMKSPEDWHPVLVGAGILAVLLGVVFLKYYLEQRKLAGYELEIS